MQFVLVPILPCLTSGFSGSQITATTCHISHPRLVTKLTKLPSSLLRGASPGWTRPSSTTPSLAPSPVSGGVSVAPLLGLGLPPMVRRSFPTSERLFSRSLVAPSRLLLRPSPNLQTVQANQLGGMSDRVGVPQGLGLRLGCRANSRPLRRLLRVRLCDSLHSCMNHSRS